VGLTLLVELIEEGEERGSFAKRGPSMRIESGTARQPKEKGPLAAGASTSPAPLVQENL